MNGTEFEQWLNITNTIQSNFSHGLVMCFNFGEDIYEVTVEWYKEFLDFSELLLSFLFN